MLSVGVRLPLRLPVQSVPESEVRVQSRTVGAEVRGGEMEAVLHVVDVADLQVTVDLVELLRRKQHVLDLGPTDPLEANVELPTRQRLRDHSHERGALEEPGAVDLGDDTEDVLAVEEDRSRIGKRELAGL